METIKPTELTHENLLETLAKNIKGGLHQVAYCTVRQPIAIVHRATQVDKTVCDSLGYEIYECFANGGTICCNGGDFLVGHWDEPENGWLDRFTVYFVAWLKDKGLNAVYEDNDILVDGYKVCGTCITRYGRIDYTAAAIGINTNLDHIKAICRKPMNKVPKGLSDYGITTEEVEQMFLDFCNNDK